MKKLNLCRQAPNRRTWQIASTFNDLALVNSLSRSMEKYVAGITIQHWCTAKECTRQVWILFQNLETNCFRMEFATDLIRSSEKY